MFDPSNPVASDPLPVDEDRFFAWSKSLETNVYYAWAQRVTPDVQIVLPPAEVLIGEGVRMSIYRGSARQELLYRISFGNEMPNRFMMRNHPFDLFWSYGDSGGVSRKVKWIFRDRNVSIHEWVDKRSYLAVLRQQHLLY